MRRIVLGGMEGGIVMRLATVSVSIGAVSVLGSVGVFAMVLAMGGIARLHLVMCFVMGCCMSRLLLVNVADVLGIVRVAVGAIGTRPLGWQPWV